MKELLLVLFFLSSLGQEIRFEVILPRHTQSIISNYRNANFSQEVRPVEMGTLVSVWSRNYHSLKLNDRIYTDYGYVEKLEPELAAAYSRLIRKGIFLKDFMNNLSIFLRSNIAYSEEDLAQDALSVLRQGKGSCIGFSNLTQIMLRCAGIPSRPAKGFLLTFTHIQAEPVSHRWLELLLAKGYPFFYDPQYQNFSGRYILINEGVEFEQVERFNGQVVTQSKRIKSF